MSKSKVIYCYETKEKFNNVTQAANKLGINRNQIVNVLDNPSRSAHNYHWCTDLELFEKLILSKGKGQTKIAIYCYETKEKFESIIDAKNKYNLKTNMNDIIDNPNRTAGNYHWCTDLAIFDNKINNKIDNNVDNNISNKQYKIVPVYCYETKERFNSVRQAQIKYNVGTIRLVLDNPNKTAGNYHWCTDLSIFDNVDLYKGKAKPIYCYETKEQFDSIAEAQKKYNIGNINQVLDNPNRTSGNYHWCTSLDKLDNILLSGGSTPIPRVIYCYETKEKFESIFQASKNYNIDISTISRNLDNPNRTVGNYHWVTRLDVFDDIELSSGKDKLIAVFCYETNEKFDSIADAQNKYNIGNIGQILDDPNRTAGNYHWCTSLDKFEDIELSSGKDKLVPVFCYETKEKFDSINQAEIIYDTGGIGLVLDNPNRTAGNYHWCTSLDNFKDINLSSGNDKLVPVFCYETKEKFDSIAEAQRKYNIGGIRSVLDNPNRTAGNHHWCTNLDKINPDDLVYPDSGISTQEKEIVEFIKSIYDGEVIENSRSIISPYELDIYLPDLNLAFEFNGDYWHSEANGKDKNYHINKTNLCKSKDIQLIHIFEYQYRGNPIIIRSMIMNKLKYNPIKLYARNCEVKLINDNNITKQFLEENHIQGYVNSNINIGLYCNDILVSIMTFGKSRFDKSIEYELLRYASLRSTNIIGGASKLLKYFEVKYKPESLVSYADISYSNGNLYSKLGFEYISTSDPDYVSIKNNVVYPRFKTMKHKLSKLLGEENFDINLTEQQNLDNNGFLRIWKCGNLKYLKEYNE